MDGLLRTEGVLPGVMAVEHTAVGLHHPTVVPADPPATDESDDHPVRCPACGLSLADH